MHQNFDPAKARAHRLREAEAGFPLLRGCPNTAAIAGLAFLDGLTGADRMAFAGQLSDYEEALLTTEMTHADDFKKIQGGFPLVEAFLGMWGQRSPANGLRFMPVKAYAGVCKDAGVGGFDGFAKMVGMPEEARTPCPAHAASRDELVPVAPRRLRKLIDNAMTARFGATAERPSSDNTLYSASLPDGGFFVDIRFARGMGPMYQFEHRFGAKMADGRRVRDAYEYVWRTLSRWDYVTEANAERSVAHFVRVVEACMELV